MRRPKRITRRLKCFVNLCTAIYLCCARRMIGFEISSVCAVKRRELHYYASRIAKSECKGMIAYFLQTLARQ